MYVLLKFSDSWSLLDVDTKRNLPLEKADIECLNRLFGALLKDDKIVNALQVVHIPPNKLVNLSSQDKREPASNGSIAKTAVKL